MKSISRTAKILDKLCGIVYWILLAAMVISLFAAVGFGFLIFRGTDLFTGNYTLTFGGLQLLLAPGVFAQIARDGYEMHLLWTLIFSLASMPVYFVMLLTVRDVLQPFIRQEPFHKTVAKDLKRLSVLVVLDAVLNWIAGGLMNHLSSTCLDLQPLFTDRVSAVSFAGFSIDLTPLLFAAALYLLSKVFQYGEELQTLSDETL